MPWTRQGLRVLKYPAIIGYEHLLQQVMITLLDYLFVLFPAVFVTSVPHVLKCELRWQAFTPLSNIHYPTDLWVTNYHINDPNTGWVL